MGALRNTGEWRHRLCFFNLGTKWRQAVSFPPSATLPLEKEPLLISGYDSG